MKKLISLACILMFVAPVLADWEPADGHKMHFPQTPDVLGWDVYATAPAVAADDWQCSETGAVCEIHFWGSWKDDVVGTIERFYVTIWSDTPAVWTCVGGDNEGLPCDPAADPTDCPDGVCERESYSMPGEVLGEWEFLPGDWVEVEIPGPLEGWYNPDPPGVVLENNHINMYQYNITHIPNPFIQQVDTIYWLSVSAQVATVEPPDPQPEWGWKSSIEHFTDDGVWAPVLDDPWLELYEPPDFTQSLDFAFVITGGSPVGACIFHNGTCEDLCEDTCNALGGKFIGEGTLCIEEIPAVSEWGLVVMALLGLIAGTIMFRKARAAAA